jgi:hypothetical protein
MRIFICGSIDFTHQMKRVGDELVANGHEVELPFTAQRILAGELTLEAFKQEKQKQGDGAFRKIKGDLIRRVYDRLNHFDAILVLNLQKKGIQGYIGGNTLLEMGFAHVLDKKIYVYESVPTMSYTDEIKAMQPVVLDCDLSRIL